MTGDIGENRSSNWRKIMNHPIISSANANDRYNGLLQQANSHRQLKKVASNEAGLVTRILASLSDALVTTEQKVASQDA